MRVKQLKHSVSQAAPWEARRRGSASARRVLYLSGMSLFTLVAAWCILLVRFSSILATAKLAAYAAERAPGTAGPRGAASTVLAVHAPAADSLGSAS
jgi:NhaP-type Na+/H+ or K+/H+ antiporter